jgi:hypothetical protein
MLCHLSGILLSLVILPGINPKPSAASPPAGPREMEVRFQDGSSLRIVALQDNLEVATAYGKLTVPTGDVRQIEFGMHLADGLGEQIAETARNLGSKSFPHREEAGKQLLAYGAKALPALRQAAKSKDLEVAQRAEALLKQVLEKCSPEELRAREDDVVVTKHFTIVGRVTTPVMKGRTKFFGEMSFKLSQVRGLRVLGDSGPVEVQVDAGKYGNRDGAWMETAAEVAAGNQLTITASGEVDLRPQVGAAGQFTCGPAGSPNFGRVAARPPAALPGALLGRIGEHGQVFVVGDRYQGVATEAGKLYLQITPSPFGNASSGSYKVKINAGDPAFGAP